MRLESESQKQSSNRVRVGDLIWVYRHPSIILIHVLGGVFAVIAPTDVLSGSAVLSAFVVKVNLLLPIVTNSALHSVFPEVTRLYAAIMLCTSPYWLVVMLRWPDRKKSELLMLTIANQSRAKCAVIHIMPIAMILIAYVYFFKVVQTDFYLAPFQHDRWALAVFGPIIYCWMVGGTYSGIIVPLNVIFRYWKGD